MLIIHEKSCKKDNMNNKVKNLDLKTLDKNKRVEPSKALKSNDNTSDESEFDEDLAIITQRFKRMWKNKSNFTKDKRRSRENKEKSI